MDDLLTTKELQELLKIDRTTVYRMLKDGRLSGTKVGEQWRFSRQEVNNLLNGAPPAEPDELPARTAPTCALPVHCVQYMQNVFAEVADVGSITVAPDGEPLSEISNCGRFCNLILATASGRRACITSWRKLAEQPEHRPRFATCHAGLQYARGRIEVDGKLEAVLIAGQFYAAPPISDEETARIQRLAETHGIDRQRLAEAAQDIPILDDRKRARMGAWLQSVAHSFEEIAKERSELIERLRRIAEMSNFEPV